jgi:hypothetical protein
MGNAAGAVPAAKAASLRKKYVALRVKLAAGATLTVLVLFLVMLGANVLGLVTAAILAGGAAYGAWAVFPRIKSDDYIRTWEIGAEGEKETGRALEPVERDGWLVHHGMKDGNGDLDHFAVSPDGNQVAMMNTKRWPANGIVTVPTTGPNAGKLVVERGKHQRSQDKDLNSFLAQADRVAAVAAQVGATATNVIVVQGAQVQGGHLALERAVPDGRNWKGQRRTRTVKVDVVQGNYLAQALRSTVRQQPNARAAARLENVLVDAFPPYPIAN